MAMTGRIGWIVVAALLAAGALPAQARDITPKAAQRAMVSAGYSGVGGVTRSGRYYHAVAIAPDGRRVRVSVQAGSGAVAGVQPLRGAGSMTPPPRPPRGYTPTRIDPPGLPRMADPNVPPNTRRAIGMPRTPMQRIDPTQPVLCRTLPNAAGC